MCGIIGMVAGTAQGFFHKDEEFFKELLIVNSLRGAHSTGVFGGRIDGEADFAKAVGNPYDFLAHKDIETFFNKMTKKHHYVVGHGRQATRGAVTGDNAHPFQIENITMVHNGTVTSSKLIDVPKHVVDSKAICHALSENNAVDVLQDIDGAYTLAWHDAKKKRFNLARNNERPLAIGVLKTSKTLVFASEKNMLSLIAYRNGVEFEELYYVPEDYIYSFKEGSLDYEEIKVPKKIRTPPVTSFPPPKETPKYLPQESAKEGRIVKIVSPSTNATVKAGDSITFHIKEVTVMNTSVKDNSKVFQVFGIMADFPELEVSFVWKGEEQDLYDIPRWQGKVANINRVQYSTKSLKRFHVYLLGVMPSAMIETFDGTLFSRASFLEMTAYGCDHCKSVIEEKDAAKVLIMENYVLCPECADKFFDSKLEVKTA